MKIKVLITIALSSLIPFNASANTCESYSLGGYTIGNSAPISEMRLMNCDKHLNTTECVTKKKTFEKNGLHYVAYFRLSDGVVYEITAEKKNPTFDDYQYFLGLMKNDNGVPAAEGTVNSYNRTSVSNGIFTTEKKERHNVKDLSFACWGNCEAKQIDTKSKSRTGGHAYGPKANTTYVKGTYLVKGEGLLIEFSKQHRKKNKLVINASCDELKSKIEDAKQNYNRTGNY